MRGRSSSASGSTSTPVTRLEPVSQIGSGAEIGQSLGEIVAAGAQRGRRPQVEHDRAWVLAFILQVAAHDLRSRAHADHCGCAGGNGARIDSREIAPARQHVEPPARGRPGGARRDSATVERRQKCGALAAGAVGNQRLGPPFQLWRRARKVPQRCLQELGPRFVSWCSAEHVQTIADGEVLDVAKLGVELGNGGARSIIPLDAALLGKSRPPRTLEDLSFEQRASAAVDAVGFGSIPRSVPRAQPKGHATPRR